MYALSTIIFVTVLVLLFTGELHAHGKEEEIIFENRFRRKRKKKFIALLLCGILTATALTGCGSSSAGG